MVQPEQPQLQRLPFFFRLRTARTANTRILAKIKMSSTVPIFFPFSESGNHRRMRPAPSTGSRASGMRQSFQGWPRCFAALLRPIRHRYFEPFCLSFLRGTEPHHRSAPSKIATTSSAQPQQPAQLEHQRGQRPRQRRLGGNSSVGPAAAFHFPAHGRNRRHAGHIQKHEHQKGHRRQR